jgi:uncharacterized SAM-binding protein YcdF (DUF218 family)
MALRLLRRLLMGIGLLYVIVTVVPVTTWWARALSGPWPEPTGDTLIVLGGDYLSDGSIGLHSYWRSLYAAREWRKGRIRHVVLSGAQVGQAMRRFLVGEGVPDASIQIEYISLSTRENALDVQKLLTERKPSGEFILMTSDYHMFRAVRAFRKAGLPVTPLPVPDALKGAAAWRGRWPVFLDLLSETAKIGYYFARGWL